ncbi:MULTISPECIES: ATP-grasp domain-containing protein [Streptomyces]|uniref:ATP-grasp domain-containing protein n=3 Tax=Streptomyces TaxID=1883 RepID=A0ABW9I9F2_STRGJ|nr:MULTISPECIES: ATP-grasp domain-containing protein [Streptomyces]MBP5861409.1 ATP-grasp domain-containing protein [Streptomyces sp. LBUM 1484]MBP5869657.1 ATP-grasp domain-containing protein [Streptomyces sp. LBUM 1485]MBP5908069.1 ATP-grasp domain-containing protein [Streptomyces sp. LBUM 1478]MBP5928950.1 ATP-grasp domain-containing protein [Streptomyces sp. LBUM 1479]KFG02901.1 carboxylase [Streptomyces scabiei]
MSARPLVLVVSPGDEADRGYCLEQVAAAYDIVLLTGAEPSWEKPHIVDHAVADLHDTTALLSAGRALAERHDLDGVVTWDEWNLVPTARLARALGLTANSVEVMRACRNKATARTLFARHGVPSAASMTARTLREAERATRTLGFPAVIKPAAAAGSIGVIRIDRPEELPAAFEFASAGAHRSREDSGVLVEEYLDGPEVSVECVTHRGTTTAVAVTRKRLGPAPYFDETGHTVDAADPLLATVAPTAGAAIAALGITDGVQHVEMRLVGGRPRLIEVNARLGGDMIGHLVHLATGVDLARAAADITCGQSPDLTPTRHQGAAIRFIYPAYSGTLTARRLTAHVGGVERVRFQRQAGDPLVLPQDGGDLYTARIGFLITTGPTAAVAEVRAQEAYRSLDVQVAPVPPTALTTGQGAA